MTARETGAIEQEKEKLEKHFQELMSCLDLEKQLRIDLEEKHAQELAMLRVMLHELQLQQGELNVTIANETEADRKVVDEALPVIKEFPIPVEDTEKINLLTAGVEQLMVLLLKESQEHSATKKALAEAQERNEELLKIVEQLQDTRQRVEENDLGGRENDAAKEAFPEAQERKEELKVTDANETINQLHDTVQKLEQKEAENQALLLKDKEENNSIKRTLAEAQERSNELLLKVEDAAKRIDQLQDTALSPQEKETERGTMLLEGPEDDATKELVTKAQERNEELFKGVKDAGEKINQPSNSVQKLQEMTTQRQSLLDRQENDATKKALAEAQEINKELLEKLDDANATINQLRYAVQWLEQNVCNVESEMPLLGQQRPPENSHIPNGGQGPLENGHIPNAVKMTLVTYDPSIMKDRGTETPQKLFNEKNLNENEELLVRCISQNIGFSGTRPIAACLIYKCLTHWRSFGAEKSGVFDRIIRIIGSATEAQDKVEILAYCLSNVSTLLLLLQQTLKGSGGAGVTPQWRRSAASKRMSHGIRASPSPRNNFDGLKDLHCIEAKYPALLFRQQLTAFLEKIYGTIRDNMKSELSPLLSLCMQAPRSHAILAKGSRARAQVSAQQTTIAHWQSIVKILASYLKIFQANYVPAFLVQKVYAQLFAFMNVQLFNSLLWRRECCSLANGEYVEAGLSKLELWCHDATEEQREKQLKSDSSRRLLVAVCISNFGHKQKQGQTVS